MIAVPTAAAQDEIERLRARIQELEQERRHLVALVEILEQITGAVHYVDILHVITRKLGEAFGLDRCSIFLAERDGRTARLVASYEDPSIRNYVVDLERYPELRRVLESGHTLHVPDVDTDPSMQHIRGVFAHRRVQSITIVPITWRNAAIGAMFLRTYRDGPGFAEADVRFCQAVAGLAAKALRTAHRFERLRERRGESPAGRAQERERVALIGFLRRLLDAYAERAGPWGEGALERSSSAELDRLVGVALTVLGQEATGR